MIRHLPTEKMNTETKTKIDELIARMGISMSHTPPTLESQENKRDGKPGFWHHLAFTAAITRNGKTAWAGPYKMGLGNFKAKPIAKVRLQSQPWEELVRGITDRELSAGAQSVIRAHISHNLLSGGPSLPDVLYSLFSDGDGYFDRLSFEEWAGNYGYDEDSRTAERMFRECQETGRKLSRAFTAAEIQELREAFQDY